MNWDKIELVIRRSVTGTPPSPEDLDLLQKAHRADPDRYASLHRKVKGEEIDRVRGGW